MGGDGLTCLEAFLMNWVRMSGCRHNLTTQTIGGFGKDRERIWCLLARLDRVEHWLEANAKIA